MRWTDDFDELLERLGLPDLGDGHVWRWWFARSLSLLELHGWFDLLSGDEDAGVGSEDYPVQETYLALRWLGEDFCAAVDDREHEPYWEEWLEALGIDPPGPYEAAKRHPAWDEVVETVEYEYPMSDDPSDYEDEWEREEDEQRQRSQLTLQSVLLVVAEKRKAIAKILIKGWDGPHRLYQGLYACVHSEMSLYLPVDVYDDDEEDEEPQAEEGPEAFESLLKRWKGMEVNALANESLDVDGSLADLGRKLGGHGWVYENCPVRVQGVPEFYAYSSFY